METGISKSTLLSCQRECQNKDQCLYYTYIVDKKQCWLKYGTGKVGHNVANMVSGWQSCACGRWGAYFRRPASNVVKNVGNIEICFKICQDNSPCKGWTYDLNDRSCSLYDFSFSYPSNYYKTEEYYKAVQVKNQIDFSVKFFYWTYNAYHTTTNARVSGPYQCNGRWAK